MEGGAYTVEKNVSQPPARTGAPRPLPCQGIAFSQLLEIVIIVHCFVIKIKIAILHSHNVSILTNFEYSQIAI